MKTQTLFLLSLSMLTTLGIMAQEKKAVAITPFTFAHNALSPTKAETVSKEVAGIISANGRLNVVNRENLKLIDAERQLQKGEDFIDGKVVQQGISQGAELLVVGHILEMNAEGPVLHLSLVDVANTQVIASEIITTSERREISVGRKVDENMSNIYQTTGSWRTANTIKTAAAAFELLKTISGSNSLKKQVNEFIAAHFPLRIGISQFEEVEKKQVKKLLILASEESGLKKNTHLQVVEASKIKEADGKVRIREQEIGEVIIEKFEGDYALCKVIKGGEELMLKQGNQNVYLVAKN